MGLILTRRNFLVALGATATIPALTAIPIEKVEATKGIIIPRAAMLSSFEARNNGPFETWPAPPGHAAISIDGEDAGAVTELEVVGGPGTLEVFARGYLDPDLRHLFMNLTPFRAIVGMGETVYASTFLMTAWRVEFEG